MKILIKNCSIITKNINREIILKGFIVIKNEYIEEIKMGSLENGEKYDKVIDASNMLVIPGLINLHIHLGETIFASIFRRKFTLEDYLRVTNKLTEKTNLIEGSRRLISKYTFLNLLRAGNTFIAGGRTDDVASKWKVKNVSGYMVMNNAKLKKYYSNVTEKFNRNYKKIKNSKYSLPAIFIHSLNTVDFHKLSEVKRLMDGYDNIYLMVHIAETNRQEREIIRRYGKTSTEVLREYDLLGPKTLLVHANWCNDKDLKLIKKTNSRIIYCPKSNSVVADRRLDFKKIISSGMNICLATDGYATSRNFSLIEEARFLYTLNKVSLSPQTLFDLITTGPAAAVNLSKEIGSIEIGKRADLVFLKKDYFKSTDYLKEIIANKRDVNVHGIMIDGKLKIWGKRNNIINENILIRKYRLLEKYFLEKVNEINIT